MTEDKDRDDELFLYASLIAAYVNPQVHWDLHGVNSWELEEELEAIKGLMGEILG